MAYNYILGMFDDEEVMLKGIKKIREAGFKIHDVLTPFPVHGLEAALNVKETRIHTAGFVFGAFGTALALGGIGWISTLDWANNFGGKPDLSLPAWIPITFELTVLCASIGMVVTFYLRNRFSIFADPEILDPRITNDRLAVVFDASEVGTDDMSRLRSLLENTGVVEIKQKDMSNKVLSFDEQS